MVFAAIAMFAMLSMLTFAIDISHWFDYSRNLQGRADAAALAAGDAYGNTCFISNPGDTQTGAQSAVGKWAQLYSGAGVAEPSGNLPYTDSQVSASPTNPVASGGPGTGWNVVANGYINNTTSAGSPVQSPLTLKAGSLSRYSVRLNANNYATKAGSNFAMGDFCNGDPTFDATDPQCFGQKHGQTSGPCAVGPMVDVKVSQAQLPNFIPIFNVHPNITGHARVALQGIQSEKGVRPLAVADATYTPCAKANFLDLDTGAPIASETLKREVDAQGNPTNTWDSSLDAKQISMPSNGDPVTVQISLNNCSTTDFQETTYDYNTAGGKNTEFGLAYMNNWGTPNAPGSGAAPALAAGGVSLTGAAGVTGNPCDPYYTESTTACANGVDANVRFQPGLNLANAFVQAKVTSLDSGATQTLALTHTSANDWNSAFNPSPAATTFAVQPASGIYTVSIQWAQTTGTIGGQTCKLPGNGNPFSNANPCNGTIAGPTVNGQANVLQRTFAGVNGTNACNNPNYDTGPVQWVDIGTTDAPTATAGMNAFGSGTTPHLYVTTSIQGLVNAPSNAGAADDICLRVAVQTQHATGFVDCGQGNGGSQDQTAIAKGCPVPPGLQKNTRVQPDGSLTCTPTITPWDCVGNDPGESPPILGAFDTLIGQGSAPANCAQIKWPTVNLSDPRAIVMVITAPIDLQDQNGAKGQQIPIRDFAVFYVTGWSSKVSGFPNGGVKGCNNNDPAPPGAVDGEIWGHWTSVAVPAGLGTGNGKICSTNGFGNCVAVLTR